MVAGLLRTAQLLSLRAMHERHIIIEQVHNLFNHPGLGWLASIVSLVVYSLLINIQIELWIKRIIADIVLSQIKLMLVNLECILHPQLSHYLVVNNLKQAFHATLWNVFKKFELTNEGCH